MPMEFFSKRSLFTHTYLLPIYLAPMLYRILPFKVLLLFSIICSLLLFLLTIWSVKINIMFCLSRCKYSNMILYNGKIRKIKNECFYADGKKYCLVLNNNKKDNSRYINEDISSDINNNKLTNSKNINDDISSDINNIDNNIDNIYDRYVVYKDSDITILLIDPSISVPVNYYLEHKSIVPDWMIPHLDKNKFSISHRSYFDTLKEHMTRPFFVFQMFCGILWCLDEYVYHAIFTIVMLFIFECGIVFQRVKSTEEFRALEMKQVNIKKNSGISIGSYDLLPGDIVVLNAPMQIPCDMVLLRGSCAVNEAMLSGESIPFTKDNIDINDLNNIDSKDINNIDNNNKDIKSINNNTDSKDINNTDNNKDINNIDNNNNITTNYNNNIIINDNNNTTINNLFDIRTHSKSVLFGGTQLIKGSNLLCYVIRTGLNTTQGRLIRTMMSLDSTVSANNRESLLFILFLLCFAVVSAIYSAYCSIMNSRSPYKILLEVVIILTNVVPPELPMELTIAVNASLQSLMHLGVFCLEPFRIPYAGKIDVVCLDKTGTLTESILTVKEYILYTTTISSSRKNTSFSINRRNNMTTAGSSNRKDVGISVRNIVKDKKYSNRVISDGSIIDSNTKSISIKNSDSKYNSGSYRVIADGSNNDLNQFRIVMCSCHSLVKMDKVAIGDPMESSSIDSLGIKIVDENTSELPDGSVVRVVRRYPFSSLLRRMTVVCDIGSNQYICMKGAPEVVYHYLGSIPDDYDKYKEYATMGYRVLSLAIRSTKYRNSMIRSDIESSLDFIGFILYECPIKQDAKEVVDVLQKSGHRVVIITGDNLLTAMSVAKQIGIEYNNDCIGVEGDSIDTILLDINSNNRFINNINNNSNNNNSNNNNSDYDNSNEYSDDDYNNYNKNINNTNNNNSSNNNNNKQTTFMDVSVFARADPTHKEKIIEKYSNNKLITMMCGDGTNDVGALKQAHVGVAIVEGQSRRVDSENSDTVRMGDASVAAPFTIKNGKLSSLLGVIRFGRGALVTTTQMYKILAINSLVMAYCLSVLDAIGVKYSDVQMTVQGVIIALSFMFLTTSKPLNKICKYKPVDSIFNKYIIISLLIQSSIHILIYILLITIITTSRVDTIVNYIIGNNLHSLKEIVTIEEKFRPGVVNTTMYIISTWQQLVTFVVNYIGRPFRESIYENIPLLGTLLAGLYFIYLCIDGSKYGSSLELVNIDLNGKIIILVCMGIDLIFCYLVEFICFRLFIIKNKK